MKIDIGQFQELLPDFEDYSVPIRQIEQLTGKQIPVDDFLKDEVPNTSWQIPVGCDRG